MKKRSLAILAGGMSLALLLSSCGPSSAPTESPSSAPLSVTFPKGCWLQSPC